MSRTPGAAAPRTDNEKYVKRGVDLITEYDPEWEDGARRANGGKVGAPYRYADALIMLAAGVRVAPGVRYRQLRGMVGKMMGGANTPAFSQLCKRINGLDADIRCDTDGTVSVSVSDKGGDRGCWRSTRAGSSSTTGWSGRGPGGR
ncbi:MAG: transposase [Thaumarchaeota archaeon]|nr:transposase [Nitrososphaerota archaeon]